MKTFNDMFNYYTELFKVPEEYSIFGNFGECCWADIIEEGLITSYPKQKVIDFLKSLGYEDESRPELSTIDILATSNNFKVLKKDLNNKLKVYGYMISKYVNNYGMANKHKIIIEPITPTKLIPDKNNGEFYHITHKSNIDKINRIGLTPKDSKTLFDHPGNRIYLIQTNDLKLLTQLKHMLADSKRDKLESENYPKHWLNEITPENMIVLRINTGGLKLYDDPMFPSYMKTFFACFTPNNISPDRIQITNN